MIIPLNKTDSEANMQSSLSGILNADLLIPRPQQTCSVREQAALDRPSIMDGKLVYTIFDGDQELLCGLMRHRIVQIGMIPINPPSILGYRDTVVRNKTKAKVLLEDVALLNKCDEAWIFADFQKGASFPSELAEGALFELLFIRRFRPRMPVFVVSIQGLLSNDFALQPFSLDQIEAISNGQSISEVNDRLRDFGQSMPRIRYFYYDPLDFKYAEWLRSTRLSHGISPLDPMLSVRLLDGAQNSDNIIKSWLSLLRLADEICHLSPLHEQEGQSGWCQLVEQANSLYFKLPRLQMRWADFGVPKALLGSRWPVTSKEAQTLSPRAKSQRLWA